MSDEWDLKAVDYTRWQSANLVPPSTLSNPRPAVSIFAAMHLNYLICEITIKNVKFVKPTSVW